jgi:two-component system sensor histidine kinase SenX3
MGKAFGSRVLIAVCGALVILLGALAMLQARWATRVAGADAQREREHLDTSASLFASEFNAIATQAAEFLRNEGRAALKSGKPLTGVPKAIAEIYYLEAPQVRRLTPSGLFETAPLPSWIPTPHCAELPVQGQPALVAPIFDVAVSAARGSNERRIVRMFAQARDRCFVARLDEAYLREELFPRLIRRSFGETSARDYDFTVVLRSRPERILYGAPVRADVRKPFFAIAPIPLPVPPKAAAGQVAAYVQRLDSTTVIRRPAPVAEVQLLGSGRWELQVAHKGMPLAEAFEQTRRRDLLASLGVEALLVAAIIFLAIGARRMQRLADQKMRFVAGVSHELRTPVSAISMLSRNQADGLVTGAEKVKQYGELIHQQSRRLNEMVEQALEYAGIHSGLKRPARAGVDLKRLIEEAVEARREDLRRGGFEVEMALGAELPPVVGDAKLLRIAVDNLLSNAEKHAASGRWIRVSAEYSAEEKEVRISVEDRGAGIDAASRAEIFEPFSRGRAAVEAQIPGSGLGLSLVRSAAEAHRGSVTLVSEAGRGSTFTLHLPV